MKKLAAVVLLVLVILPAAQAREYRGADAGMLVISMGTIGSTVMDTYLLNYKLAEEKPNRLTGDPYFWYGPTDIFGGPKDFTGREIGQVQVHRMKPGNYEIYTYLLKNAVGISEKVWAPDKAFSIPFTIKPGETTYIGDFAGVALLGGYYPVDGYFVLSDQHERDIPIARRKEPGLMPVAISVADPFALGIPEIKADCPVMNGLPPQSAVVTKEAAARDPARAAPQAAEMPKKCF